MQIGPYEILGELGRGGMGVVYRARRDGLPRDFALKVIKGDGDDPGAMERFRREARAAAALSGHPGIVGVTDIGEADGQVYFAMDCVEGRSLEQVIDSGDVDARDAATLIEQAARAMQHAHRHGVLHRDLKPANILVTDRGEARITDFGLVKFQRADAESARLTHSGIVIGTPHYMPPEQARSEGLDARADVYSLGATLYEVLVGSPPFDGDSLFEVLGKLMREEPRPPRSRDPRVPEALQVIVMKCLEKDREQRYPSAGALADDLGRWLRDEPIVARTPSMGRRARRWIDRHRTLAVGGVLLLGGAAATTGVWLSGRGQSAQDRRTIDQLSAEAIAAKAAVATAKASQAAAHAAAALAVEAQASLQTMQLLLRIPEPDGAAVRAAAEKAQSLATEAIGKDPSRTEPYVARAEARMQLGLLEQAHADTATAVDLRGGAAAERLHARVGLQRYLRARGVPVPILAHGVLIRIFQLPASEVSEALRPAVPADPGVRPPELEPALALVDGKALEALRGFDAAVAAEPFNALAYLYRGHARVLLLDVEQARADYDRARQLTPALAEAHHGLATCALFRGDAATALAACDAAPPGPVTARLRAQARVIARDLEGAVHTISDAIERWPELPGLRLWRFVVLAPERRTEAQQRLVLDDLSAVIAAQPDHWYARSLRGGLLKRSARNAEAVADLSHAVRLRPEDGYLQAQLANALMPLGRHLEALRAHLRWHICEQLWVEGRRDELQKELLPDAIATMDALLVDKPGDPELTLLRAMAIHHLPGKNAAQTLASQRGFETVEDDPVCGPIAKLFLGQGFMGGGNLDRALALLTDAAAGHPGCRVQVAPRLATLLRGANRPHDELVVEEQVMATDPVSGPHNYNLAASYVRLGGVKAAVPLLMRTTYFYTQSLAHGLLAQMRIAGLIDDPDWRAVEAGCARVGALRGALANHLGRFGLHAEALEVVRALPHGAIREHAVIEAWALLSGGHAPELIAHETTLLAACGTDVGLRHEVHKALARAHFVSGNLAEAARCMAAAGAARHSTGGRMLYQCAAPEHAAFLARMAASPTERWNHNDFGAAAMMCVRAAAPQMALAHATRARELRDASELGQSATADLVAIQAGSLVRLGRADEAVALIEGWGYRPTLSPLVDPVAVTAYLRAGRYARASALGAVLLRDDANRPQVLGATALAMAEDGRRYEAALAGTVWLRVVTEMAPVWQVGGHLDPREVREAIWGAPPEDHEGCAAHAVLAMDHGDLDRVIELVDRAVASIGEAPAAGRELRHGSLLALRARAMAGLAIAAAVPRWRAGPALPNGASALAAAVRHTLEEAWRLGWRRAADLDQHYEFVVLRRLPDFQRFAEELAARPR